MENKLKDYQVSLDSVAGEINLNACRRCFNN